MANAERNFARGVNHMSKVVTRIPLRAIILGEAGVILKESAFRTKVAAAARIEKGARLRALRGLDLTNGKNLTVNAGVKAGAPFGRVWIRKKDGVGFRLAMAANFKAATLSGGSRDGARIHFSEDQWNRISQAAVSAVDAVARAVPAARKTAALARQSWILIADALGLKLENVPGGKLSSAQIAEARKAVAKGGAQINNGASIYQEAPGKVDATLINRLPYGRKIGLAGVLRGVVAGRAKFMRLAVAHGFDGGLRDTARLFPAWQMIGKRNPSPFY